ncbi:hypothetical protein KP806_17610 [Paenibacillus sp. N4]|uniref:hypothetical protein n=1 Tax=Paenibacillus vietnamensis TaxID=2590547 RepID=UPI001CD1193A|nr:hypothetical protein [Paenibacillus vietnamensis]MCA0756878.1 hypothetical protein [Paenibacillus vietnamensis]
MNTNRTLKWAVIGAAGFAAVLLLLKAIALFGHTNYVYIHQGPGRGGHGGYVVMREISYQHQAFAPLFAAVFTALKLAALAAALWLWTKSSGILRVVTAFTAGLALMSLLSPLWGALLVIALLLIRSRSQNDASLEALSAGEGAIRYGAMPTDKGSFLDEWERKTRGYFLDKQGGEKDGSIQKSKRNGSRGRAWIAGQVRGSGKYGQALPAPD